MNPIDVEVFRHAFESIAEEMGVVLQRTSYSPNIKERLDFSCAVTGPDGAMIAQAAHIPVHLGSCHLTARAVTRELELEPGDVVILNDPFRGGTHLPDITLFEPVFVPGVAGPAFGVLSRAHHADVGGGVPGSMGDFDEIWKEGLVIPPVKLVSRGREVPGVRELILANVRTPDERRGDLAAQRAATARGATRVRELVERYGAARALEAADALVDRAARAMRAIIAGMPDGRWTFADVLDAADGPRIAVAVEVRGESITIDFAGTSPTMASSLNAHEAITLSCVFYVLRCLGDDDLPTNSGVLDPLDLRLPADTIVGARHPAAVAGGNVETSQRIVDALFGALAQALPDRIPAASQGTMNNLSLGGRRADGRPFAYFETIAGGCGATADQDGACGLHTHMTNTLNTPIESIELELPVRIRRLALRAASGGSGRRRGGDGIVREIEALSRITATLLATRRASAPWGLAGGADGAPGVAHLLGAGGERELPARVTVVLEPGDVLRIATPGGGAHGPA